MIEEEILAIQNDLMNQEIFVKKIIALIHQIGFSKREDTVTDLEIGFKLGEIFRMLHEFNADSIKLKEELNIIFEKIISNRQSENDHPKIYFDK